MWIVLQRSATAREAIENIGKLVEKWGWKSTGESFSIADKNEVWIMDIGNFELPKLGAVWVARKVPDGYVSAHANQPRVQKFPLNDPENCLYQEDTIQFARDRGWYNGTDEDFSFSDVYSPITFSCARYGEARVWTIFNNVTTGMDKYVEYAKGHDLSQRMPLWVKPTHKLNVHQVFEAQRDNYEGTWFDMLGDFDVGNQPYHVGQRFGGYNWESGGKKYINERPVSYSITDYSVVSQLRKWMPDGLGAIQWFSFDDTATNCYFPLFSTLESVPDALGKFPEGFSWDSAYWLINLVSNYAYSRYKSVAPVVKQRRSEIEYASAKEINDTIDVDALKIYHDKGPEAAYKYLSDYSVGKVEEFMKEWQALFAKIFTQFYDGRHVEIDQKWRDYVVEKTGDHFLNLDGKN